MQQIYHHGRILTMYDLVLYVEALLVENGRIRYAGSEAGVRALCAPDAQWIDLRGRTLMPAFIDAHSHYTSVAQTFGLASLDGACSFDEIVTRLQRFCQERSVAPGAWLVGFGYDHNALEEKSHPDKALLDRVFPDHPVLLSHASGHMGVMNSLALQQCGIDAHTPDPNGGRIGRLPGSNEPNGYLEENAFIQNSTKMPAPSKEALKKQLRDAQALYAKHGITTLQDGLVKPASYALLQMMAECQGLYLDVVGYVDLNQSKSILESHPIYENQYVNHFKLGGYKIFLDGSPQGRTAWLTQPYENAEDGYCGYPIYTDEQVERFIETTLTENQQLLAHCNGDAAADQYIRCFQRTLRRHPSLSPHRPVMIHAQTVRPDQVAQMAALSMIPSYFVAHVYHWGDIHIQNLGMERASRISPARTTVHAGIPYTFHQDSPVIAPDMLQTVWCAVNRITKDGVQLGQAECISVLEALKGVTTYAAYQYFEEDDKGTLTVGKRADMVLLDRDPLQVKASELRNIQVLATYKDGALVYQA